jgi:hypothetical protein
MTTTAVLSEDTTTIVRDEVSPFEWGAVIAASIIGTAITFFLVSVGTGIGLSLVSVHGATAPGAKTFVTGGAVYFLAANAFGFAVAGYVAGRMMRGVFSNSEEDHFRTDVHALAVWGLGVVFGAGLLVLTAGPTISAGAANSAAATPVNYWVDRLFRPASSERAELNAPNQAPPNAGLARQEQSPPAQAVDSTQASPPIGASPLGRSLGDIKAEAGRLLTASAANRAAADDNDRLSALVSQTVGLNPEGARQRVLAVEGDMTAKAKEAADAARKAASYVGIWTALALLFSAIVCVASALYAREPAVN